MDDAARDEHTGYVRPADRAAFRLLENFIESDGDTERIELLDDSRGARVSLLSELAQFLLQRV
jgi:hypothetical protein